MADKSSRSFIIERDALLEAARAAGRPVEARNTIPICSNLLLDARPEQLAVRGTDLAISAEVVAPCDCAEPLRTTVPAQKLVAAIDTLRSAPVVVTAEPGKITLKQDRSVRTLAALPAEDFPLIALGDLAAEFVMEGKDLAAMIDAVRFAMSTEETRYYLHGVFLHVRGGLLTAAATDGVRMMRATAALPDGAADLPDTILSAKSVNLLSAMVGAAEGAQVRLRFGERKVEAEFARTRLILKIVDGSFPDYARVIPTANKMILKVHAAEMARGIRAAAAIYDMKSRAVKLDMSSDGCNVQSSGQGADHANEPLDAEFGPGSLDIAVNASLAAQMMTAFGEAASLDIAFADRTAPILVTSPARPALTGVIMPLRV